MTIVVFYSRSGITKKVGELIAKRLDCKSEEIIDKKNRKGIVGSIGAVLNPRGKTEINEMNDPKEEIVIIGTPIWWYTQVPAVKAYIEKYRPKRVAFFYTCSVDKKIKAFSDMEKSCEMVPLATMAIDKNDLKDLENSKKLELFVSSLRERYLI